MAEPRLLWAPMEQFSESLTLANKGCAQGHLLPTPQRCYSCALSCCHLNSEGRDQEGTAYTGSSHRGNPKTGGKNLPRLGLPGRGLHWCQCERSWGQARLSSEGMRQERTSVHFRGHCHGGHDLLSEAWTAPGRGLTPPGADRLHFPEEALGLQARSLLLLRLSPSLDSMPRSAQEAGCWAKYLVQVMSKRKKRTSGVYKP